MADRLHVTVLGCGSSPGVPRIGGHWGACDPENPRNRRLRCSILVRRITPSGAETCVLVDTSPDMRAQMLAAGVKKLDGVLYTHAHADHLHGIDDLRSFVINMRRRVDVYADAPTLARMKQGFGYCFETPEGSDYPPIVDAHVIEPGALVSIRGDGGTISALPIAQQHGAIRSLGFRFGGFAYSPDVSGLDGVAELLLADLDVWMIDALRYTPHPSHFSVDEALASIERLRPKRAILTHMHIDLDYETLCRSLPHGIEPAYDGMTIELPAK